MAVVEGADSAVAVVAVSEEEDSVAAATRVEWEVADWAVLGAECITREVLVGQAGQASAALAPADLVDLVDLVEWEVADLVVLGAECIAREVLVGPEVSVGRAVLAVRGGEALARAVLAVRGARVQGGPEEIAFPVPAVVNSTASWACHQMKECMARVLSGWARETSALAVIWDLAAGDRVTGLGALAQAGLEMSGSAAGGPVLELAGSADRLAASACDPALELAE